MSIAIRHHRQSDERIGQGSLFDPQSAAAWDRDLTKRALDELFILAQRYRSSQEYLELMQFIARFRDYAPFNAMLVRTQMQGARFVAPASRWLRDYGRRIKPSARPLVILQPMGPVMFVFDVTDTTAEPGAPPLPIEVEQPFAVGGAKLSGQLERTIQNAARDGVEVHDVRIGSQGAGMITTVGGRRWLQFPRKVRPKPEYVQVPVRYDVLLSDGHSPEMKYATLVHELAHLYCGHLGTLHPRWWPDRRFVDTDVAEFEAESVSHLVCHRLGLETRSEGYLSGYTRLHETTPEISLECVLKAAGLIEQMGSMRMPVREEIK